MNLETTGQHGLACVAATGDCRGEVVEDSPLPSPDLETELSIRGLVSHRRQKLSLREASTSHRRLTIYLDHQAGLRPKPCGLPPYADALTGGDIRRQAASRRSARATRREASTERCLDVTRCHGRQLSVIVQPVTRQVPNRGTSTPATRDTRQHSCPTASSIVPATIQLKARLVPFVS
jgi:hypothetical protein